MPAYQTNVYICERCGFMTSSAREIDLYEDRPSVPEQAGWEYDVNTMLCPVCANQDKIAKAAQETGR